MGEEAVNDTKNIDRSVSGALFERFFTGRNEAKRGAPRTLFMTGDYVKLQGDPARHRGQTEPETTAHSFPEPVAVEHLGSAQC
jgi:hypothetical protein